MLDEIEVEGGKGQVQGARDALICYIKVMAPWFQVEEIHCLIAHYFEKVRDGLIDRLMLFCPPRVAKSTMASIFLPSWWMGQFPSDKIMAVGYKMDLPRRFSRQVMGQMRTREYDRIFPGVRLARDAHAVGYWNVEDLTKVYDQIQRGEYQAAGVTSGIAGSGFNLGIIDDPLSEQDKESKIAKDRVWEWWGPGFYTRRQPDRNAIILINTRWALDDLSGRLIEASRTGGDKWEIVNIPALLDGDSAKKIYQIAKNYPMADARELKAGESLCPRRITTKEMLRSKANMPERDWQALFMGNPSEEEGQIIKRAWWRLWPHKDLPEIIELISFWDTAFEEHERADYSAMTSWGLFEHKDREGRPTINAILMHKWKRRVESPDLPKIVTAFQYGTKAVYPKHADQDERMRVNLLCGFGADENVPAFGPDLNIIENKASGITLIKELRRQRMFPLPVRDWTPPRGDGGKEKGKYARAQFGAWVFERGSIWYPDRKWAETVIDGVAKCRFDGTDESDDLEDTVVMMATYMRQKYKVEVITDINEDEEARKAVTIRKRRGYGVTG